ncbi:hypothetical protein Cgig2_024586 [Carnegiea gigantea]|uniref:Uncharacterized protein n=1 Tax=Carnegiea gigantea TaxID=171969 RepID=A0A9Q1KIL6_9CARY|nr:hypothetical protein Cgig2_024586 [Carnegiea gigantea]
MRKDKFQEIKKFEKWDLCPMDHPHQEKKVFSFDCTRSHIRNHGWSKFSNTFVSGSISGKDNVQLRVVNYIFYGNDEATWKISNTLLNWNQDNKSSSIEEARASFVEVRTNAMIRYFIRINLAKFAILYMGRRNDPLFFFNGDGWYHTNMIPFYSIFSKTKLQQSFN